MVIFQAGAYVTLANTGGTNSSPWTLIGPGCWKTLSENTPRQSFCACATARSEFEKQEKSFSMAANSTVMYSGLDPSAKSSSKVLAPPGGRSSIGFGPEEDLASKAQAEPTPEPIPEPRSIFQYIKCAAGMVCFRPEGEEPTDQIPVKPEESNEEAPAEKPAAEPAKKMPETEEYTKAMGPQGPMVETGGKGGRKVPPGGFSSGAFW